MKILIVDDHVLIREALGVVLRELKGEGLHVLEASNLHQAKREIEDNPDVELVLVDLSLADRDGFEVLSELADNSSPSRGRLWVKSTQADGFVGTGNVTL